jgi:hypothetical protein
MAKDKDEARAEGFQRGLDGKSDAAGFTQGWKDDKDTGPARTEGWVAGKRKRAQNEAVAARKAKAGK